MTPDDDHDGHPVTDPTGPTEDEVAVLRPGQHGAAAAAISAGHADYPTFRHVFPDPRRRARALRAFFSATVRDAIPLGAALATWRGSDVAATAVWLPPGGFPWSTRRKLAATPALTRVLLADPRAFPTFMRYGAAPAVRAALDAVRDPVGGLLVHRGRGGSAGVRWPRRPRPLAGAGAVALPEPKLTPRT